MIRSSALGLDVLGCGIQGYVGAYTLNVLRGATVAAPLNAAICFGGGALIEQVIYKLSQHSIPGSTAFLGPIPIGTKNLVSYGLAIYTTLKIMELVGLILNVPTAIRIVGLVCAAALTVGGVSSSLKAFRPKSETLKQPHSKAVRFTSSHYFNNDFKRHLCSEFFSVKLFIFRIENKDYHMTVFCNPRKRLVEFNGPQREPVPCRDAYILACQDEIPVEFLENFKSVTRQANVFTFIHKGGELIEVKDKSII